METPLRDSIRFTPYRLITPSQSRKSGSQRDFMTPGRKLVARNLLTEKILEQEAPTGPYLLEMDENGVGIILGLLTNQSLTNLSATD
jgi:hypothetical protein